MAHSLRHITLLTLVALLAACAGYNQSSIPQSPVRVRIDTRIYTFCNPGNVGSYVYMDAHGYHKPTGEIFLLPPRDERGFILTDQYAYGYAGVILVNGLDGKYAAYDLCCPKCLSAINPLHIDSYARLICPKCGEEYDTMNSGESGTGFPTKGISKEGLKRYFVSYNNFVIQVYN